jgi:hypothetical protein
MLIGIHLECVDVVVKRRGGRPQRLVRKERTVSVVFEEDALIALLGNQVHGVVSRGEGVEGDKCFD